MNFVFNFVFNDDTIYKYVTIIEDNACYNVALQICKDYEEGMLWYSEAN